MPSRRLLEKFGFERWGVLPEVDEFDGRLCGQWYYGRGWGKNRLQFGRDGYRSSQMVTGPLLWISTSMCAPN